MSQYKHKIIDAIATPLSNFEVSKAYWIRGSNICTTILHAEFVENSNDWEKIEEKDWEIIAFSRCYGGIKVGLITMFKGKWTGAEEETYTEDQVTNSHFTIYSVKRLSDGEEFKIGDIVQCKPNHYELPIEAFYIEGGKLWTKVNGTAYSSLESLVSVPKKVKLFTTEDGVDIYEGDYYAFVRRIGKYFMEDEGDDYKLFEQPHAMAEHVLQDKQYPGRYINFSTKEAAEKYIKWNKPKYSLLDITSLLDVSEKDIKIFEKFP